MSVPKFNVSECYTAVGDRPWLRGTNMVMLSAIDGPPGPRWQLCMVQADHPRLPQLVRGTNCGGTIGSVTDSSNYDSLEMILPLDVNNLGMLCNS